MRFRFTPRSPRPTRIRVLMADKFQESARPADTAPATHGNAGPGQSVRYGGVILSRRKWPTRSISKSSPHFESQSPGANGTGLQRAQECWPHGLVVRESLGVLLKGHFFALLLPPLVEMRCHGVIKHLLAPWRATGDVFGIQENAACRQ